MRDRPEGGPALSIGAGAGAGLAEGPFFIDGCDTLVKLFLLRCRTLGERAAHREKELGIWRSHSWAAFLDAARAIGLGLAELGLKRGDVVSILSEDNKEWIYADIGVQCVGGIVSGVYTTDSPDQVAYLLDDSGSRFLVVENDEQLDKFLEIRERVPEVVKCIVLDRGGLDDFSDETGPVPRRALGDRAPGARRGPRALRARGGGVAARGHRGAGLHLRHHRAAEGGDDLAREPRRLRGLGPFRSPGRGG